ncbi:MAG: energy transducer TonB [Janthinobacterium lividum]
MVLASSNEHLAVRFAPYVEELHDFFAGCSVHFGTPQDIFPFAERLSTPGVFHEEMSSMVRAVIYREHESLTQADLLALITSAVAGPEIDLTAPEFRPPVRQLLGFISGALRSLWRRFPEEPTPPQTHPVPQPAAALEPTMQADAQPQAPPVTRFVEEVQVRSDTERHKAFGSDTETTPLISHQPGPFSRLRALWRDPEPASAGVEDGSYPEYKPVALFQARYRPLWIVGLCGISVGLGTGLMLRNRPPAYRPPPQRTAQTIRPWSPSIAQPVYDPAHEANAGSNVVDTFQADNAALQAANAALRAANAVLPPLPAPAKPSPYGPTLGNPTNTALISNARPIDDRRPASLPNASKPNAALRKPTGHPGANSPAYTAIDQLGYRSPAPYRALGQAIGPQFTGPMSGQSRPAPFVEARGGVFRGRQASHYSAFPRSAPSEQAHLAMPMQPRLERAFPSIPYAREYVSLSATGVMAANLMSAPAPEYPPLASSSHVEGKVVVQAVIGTDGNVIATRILSGPQFLRSAAETAVRRWRYRPYLVDGRPAVVATDAILNFQLNQ